MRLGIRLLLIVASWLIGAVIVRVGLDWADTFEYSPASETRYLVVAVVALAVAIGGSVFALVWRRRGTSDK